MPPDEDEQIARAIKEVVDGTTYLPGWHYEGRVVHNAFGTAKAVQITLTHIYQGVKYTATENATLDKFAQYADKDDFLRWFFQATVRGVTEHLSVAHIKSPAFGA